MQACKISYLKLFTCGCSCCARPSSKPFATSLAPRPIHSTASPSALLLEHRRMPKHVGKNKVTDLGSSEVDLLQIGDLAIPSCHGDALEHCIHVILTIHKVPTVHLSCFQLASHRVPYTLMQQLHGDTECVGHRLQDG